MAARKVLVLGRVLEAWGLRGEVKVRSFPEAASLLSPGQPVILRGPGGESEMRLEAIRPLRHVFVAGLQGVRTRTAAEALKGYEICIPRGTAPVLPEATYYHDDILGLEVRTETGEALGEIVNIWSSDAHDLYVVRRDGKEWLLPAVRAFILRVDLENRVMVVRPIKGLVDAETV